MQTADTQKIIKLFFQTFDFLKEAKVIRGRQTFTRMHGINRWNMNTVEKNPVSDMFQTAWLTYLVEDFGISAHWLLTGNGNMFINRDTKSAQTANNSPVRSDLFIFLR